MAQTNILAAPQDISRREAGFAALPLPPGYRQVGAGEVSVDGGEARLVRYERADGRNSGFGGEHFSTVTDPSGRLKGFTRMDLSLREGELPGEDEAQNIAMRFLGAHAPDLLPGLRISFIAPHEETVQSAGRPVTLTGMKVKMRNMADGRWFWVIVGSDREVMVFERDIVWADLQGRRLTEMWLHDRWLEEHGADFLRDA
ncbi:hypothetical protein LCM4573_14280 [Rhizobium sp. LCM 4573]|nr:hypothetical protein LCM4573_14280 [Rhizobium sp. LCM 4573]